MTIHHFQRFLTAYYKTRNVGTRNTGGTPEHPETVAEHPGTVVEQRNTPEYQRNNNVTPAEHPGTTEQ